MRKILFYITFLCCIFTISPVKSQQESIRWMSFEEAIKANDKKPKKILVDVYTNWCGPCRMLNSNTFTNKRIIELINKYYYPVKFNAEGPDTIIVKGQTYVNPGYDPNVPGRNSTHQLTYAIANVNGRIAYPTIVYMDENSQIIQAIQGYMTPQQLEPILIYFGEDHYKTTPWEKFLETFQSKIGQ